MSASVAVAAAEGDKFGGTVVSDSPRKGVKRCWRCWHCFELVGVGDDGGDDD